MNKINGIIIVDKPEGITSHGVVSRLRRVFKIRRIGHSGTLDPMATGVLPIFIGRATRACEFTLTDGKAYTARFRTGIETDTQDITGTVTASHDDGHITESDVLRACNSFAGKIMQTPPMYSAVKVGGVPLYKLAREGKEAERRAREITINGISLRALENGEYEIDVDCSKGTYIRTLIFDIGRALGCGATMTYLRRTRSGIFRIENAVKLDDITEDTPLLPVDTVFSEYEKITVSKSGEKKCRNGADVPFDGVRDGAFYRVYSGNGEFLMLARGDSARGLVTEKSFFEV